MSLAGKRGGWALAVVAALAAAWIWMLDSGDRDDVAGPPPPVSDPWPDHPVLHGPGRERTPPVATEDRPFDPAFARVEVRVTDWSGRPLAGARVETTRLRGSLELRRVLERSSAEATTDESGVARIELPIEAPWMVFASAEGSSRTGVRLGWLTPSDTPTRIVLRLGPGCVLAGRVLDAEGRPVDSAELLVSTGAPSQAPELEIRAVSGTDGAYAMDALPVGELDLFVRRPAGALRPAARVRLPFSGAHDIRLADAARLSGRVLGPGDGPVAGARVRLHLQREGVSETQTDASGAYVLEDVGEDERWNFLSAVAPGLTLAPAQQGYLLVQAGVGACLRLDAMRPGDEREQDVRLVPAAHLEGCVRGPEGPLPNARVRGLVGADDTGYASIETTCDEAGRYVLAELAPGRVFLSASDGRHVLADVPVWNRAARVRKGGQDAASVVLRAGERAELDLLLVVGASASGRVQGVDGSGVAGASVWVGPPVPAADTPRALTDLEGKFAVIGLTPNVPTNAWASRDGYALNGATAFTPGEGGEVVVRMHAWTTVHGRVRAPDGDLPAGTRVKGVAGGAGIAPVDAWGRFQRASAAPVRDDGTFEVEVPLLQGAGGEAWILALAPGYAPTRSAPVRLSTDRPRPDVEILLARGDRVVVSVSDASSGHPVAGATLVLTSTAQDAVVEAWEASQPVSDGRGEISIECLVRGRHVALVRAPGYVPLWLRWSDASAHVEARLSRSLSIVGSVLASDDSSPVVGAVVAAEPLDVVAVPSEGAVAETTRGRATTSREGGFRLSGLASGRYRLRVTPPARGPNLAPTTIDAGAGDEALRILLCGAGLLAGIVVGPDGSPLRDLVVRVAPDGIGLAGETRETKTAHDGTWRLTGLAAPTFAVRVVTPLWGQGEELLGAQRTGVASGTEDLRFVLEEGLVIEGVVVGPDGEPAVGLPLGTATKRAVTQEGGRFALRGLEPGDHRIFVHDGWHNPTGLQRLEAADQVPAGARGLRLRARR